MLQLLLRNIRLNKISGFYETNEARANYQIDPALIESLLEFLKENPGTLIADWHRNLSEAERLNVTKIYR